MNTFGRYFRLTTFGESHGPAVGGVLDGCPSGIELDMDFIAKMLHRRSSRSASWSTPRAEEEHIEWLSGLFEGRTTGTPIAFLIRNKGARPLDYDHLKDLFRPSHADYTYEAKYGLRDYRGGGRASARETVVRVVAGAIALQILHTSGIRLLAYTEQIGSKALPSDFLLPPDYDPLTSQVGCPLREVDEQMQMELREAREQGDTLGGIATLRVDGLPPGLGSPLYGKLEARLAEAIMSIGAARGIEFGTGFALASMRGSEANDPFLSPSTEEPSHSSALGVATNHSGGIQGGISNGAPIQLRVVFRPIPSIAKPQKSVSREGKEVELTVSGRHDVSVFPRVLPVLEAMVALVLVDELLAARLVRL